MKVVIIRGHDGLNPAYWATIKWGQKSIMWTQKFSRKLVLLNSVRRMARNFCTNKWTIIDETK